MRISLLLLSTLLICSPSLGQVAAQKGTTSPFDLIRTEIEVGLDKRKQTEAFDRYHAYTANKLDTSEGDKTWSDKTGNCRLQWVDKLLRDQLWAIGESDRFTRNLFLGCTNANTGLLHAVRTSSEKLEAVPAELHDLGSGDTLEQLVDVLSRTHVQYQRFLEPLTTEERKTLRDNLYDVTTGPGSRGHRFAKGPMSRTVCDLMEKADLQRLHAAAQRVALFADLKKLDELYVYTHEKLKPDESLSMPGVEGKLVKRISTPAGDILIGWHEANTYHVDELINVACIVDMGGNDTYVEGTTTDDRPILLILDLRGDDKYTGEKPGIQGSAIMGISLLADSRGNDTYQAVDVAQGSCLLGAGLLVDYGGDDHYVGRRRAQGVAIGGPGILLDQKGNDKYRSALVSQGIGGPLGFGLLCDLNGNDEYFAGGMYPNVYGDSPGFDGFSQGVGIGPRGVANGGIGTLLDGGGDDIYECDYFSHAGGYWFAAGFARDFGGNDKRVGATRTMHDGSERTEKRFLRWGLAFQAHYGIGVLIDDEGNDTYQGNTAGIAFSWDIGLAMLADLAGNDYYENPHIQGEQAALGILFDGSGDDHFKGGIQGMAREKPEYHPVPDAGGNFSFLIDYSGENIFKDAKNDSYNQVGAPSGFLISRPKTPTIEQIKQTTPK